MTAGLVAGLVALAACDEETPPAVVADATAPGSDGAVGACAPAGDEAPETARTVSFSDLAEGVTGRVCAANPVDWLGLSPPAGSGVVQLTVTGAGVGWALHPGAEGPAGTPLGEGTGRAGVSPAVAVCVPPGPLRLAVRAPASAPTVEAPYRVSARALLDPDRNEPNDRPGQATALVPGTPAAGAVACAGDLDRFRLAVPAGQLVRLRLQTAAAGAWQPRLRVFAAEPAAVDAEGALVTLENLRGASEPTDLETLLALPPGPVWLVVDDRAGTGADALAGYTLAATLVPDLDGQEPNDHPGQAAPLATLACAPAAEADFGAPAPPVFGAPVEAAGAVSVAGDLDWFRVPVTACDRGLLRAEVELDETGLSPEAAYALRQRFTLALGLGTPAPDSPCVEDDDCRTLARPCRTGWDCAGLGNVCLPEGRCAGGNRCLPEGVCSALRLLTVHDPGLPEDLSVPLPPHRAVLTVPWSGAADALLVVGGLGAEGSDPSRRYALRVRVGSDPDRFEPSNVYAPILSPDDPLAVQWAAAATRPALAVTTCEAPAPPGDAGVADAGASDAGGSDAGASDGGGSDGGASPEDAGRPEDAGAPEDASAPEDPFVGACCLPETERVGNLGYPADQDWHRFAHPCPGQDCGLQVRYAVEAGPAEVVFEVRRDDGSLLAAAGAELPELAAQPARAGRLGGPEGAAVDGGAGCLAALASDVDAAGAPRGFAVRVLDGGAVAEGEPTQRYRLCVERTDLGCAPDR